MPSWSAPNASGSWRLSSIPARPPVLLQAEAEAVTPFASSANRVCRRARSGRSQGPHALRRARHGAEPLEAQFELARATAGTGDAGHRRSGRQEPPAARTARALAGSDAACLQGRCRSYGGLAVVFSVRRDARALGCSFAGRGTPAVAKIVAPHPRDRPVARAVRSALSAPAVREERRVPLPQHLRGEPLQAAMVEALAALLTAWHTSGAVAAALKTGIGRTTGRGKRCAAHGTGGAYPLVIVVTSRPEPGTAGRPADRRRASISAARLRGSVAIIEAVLGVARVPEALARVCTSALAAIRSFSKRSARRSSRTAACTRRDGEGVVAAA